MAKLADLVRERRRALGLTMTQVVHKSRYGKFKQGLRRLRELEDGSPHFDIKVLNRFVDALEISPGEVDQALEADRGAEEQAAQERIENQNRLYRLIIRHREALVAHDPWTVLPFSTNSKFGDRENDVCIGAMALLWKQANDLQPACDCGDRFYIVSWLESQAGGQIAGFGPGCHTHREVGWAIGHECFEMLKPYLDGTEFHMSLGGFPHAFRPDSAEVLVALGAVGVDVGGIEQGEIGRPCP